MSVDQKKLASLIEAIFEQEFVTKTGDEISFKVYEKSPRKNDQLGRGWVVHLIEAYVNGEDAGYIKISYIPKENFKKQYPTILHYIDKITGSRLWPPRDRVASTSKIKTNGFVYWSDHLDELDLVTQIIMIGRLINVNMFSDWDKNTTVEDLENKPISELLKIKKDLIKKIEDRYKEGYEGFKNFHINKPIVDYIDVEEKFRRNKIATALYLKAAKWLVKKGLKLHASGIQSKEAKKTWDYMKSNKDINVKSFKTADKERFYIDVNEV